MNAGNIRDPRDSQDSPDFSTTFDALSSSISSNTSSLNTNSDNLSRNAGSLDRNTQALLEMARQFQRSVSDFSDASDRLSEDSANNTRQTRNDAEHNLRDMQNMFARSNRSLERTMTLGQKISSSFIGTFEIVGKRLFNEFTSAASRVSQKYKEQFSNITVRMQWSQSDYSEMFNSMSARFQSEGLNKSFSPVDYADALSDALAIGLRGDEAQRQAYNNLITNKLIPSITTNTTAYRKMSKTFSDSFDQNILAVSKYTEALYGAEFQEEGKANALLEQVQASLRYSVASGQLSDEEAMKSLSEMSLVLSKMESEGINTDEFMSMISAGLNGAVDSLSDFQREALGFVDAGQFQKKFLSDPMSVLEQVFEAYRIKGSVATSRQELNILGGDPTTQLEVSSVIERYRKEDRNFFDEAEEELLKFNSSAEFEKSMKKLQGGHGSTADDIVNKIEENTMTSLGVLESEIPRFEALASDVKAILSLLATNLIFTGLSKGGTGSGTNLLTRLPSSLSGAGAAGSPFAAGVGHGMHSFFSPATRAANAANGLGSAGATVGTTAAGIVGIAAGTVMGGIDAYENITTAQNEGLSTGETIGHGVRGFFTGGTLMTQEERSSAIDNALQGAGREFDWGEMFANVGKGAAIGSGAGTLAGSAAGGVGAIPGALIGGAIGGIAGALTNAIDQWVENAKYNTLADATKKFSDSLSKTSQSIDNYQNAIKRTEKVQDSLRIVTGETSASEERKKAVYEQLQEMYPTLLGNTEEYSELSARQIELLKEQVEREERLAGIEAANSLDETVKSANEALTASEAILPGQSQGRMTEDTLNLLNSLDGLESSIEKQISDMVRGGLQKDQVESKRQELMKEFIQGDFQYLLGAGAQSMNMSLEDYQNYLNSAVGDAGFLGMGGTSLVSFQNTADGGFYTLNTTKGSSGESGFSTSISNFKNRFDTNTGAYKNFTDDQLKDQSNLLIASRNAVEELLYQADRFARTELDEEGNLKITPDESLRISRKSTIEKIVEAVKKYNEHDLRINGGGSPYKSSDPVFDTVRQLAEAYGVGNLLQFKVGAYNIPRDDTFALLHQGEMVLTAANANKLRNLGSGGISGFLDGLTAMKSDIAYAKVSGSMKEFPSNSTATVTAALQSQTDAIVGVLNTILTAILQIKPTPALGGGTTTLSESLLSFSR